MANSVGTPGKLVRKTKEVTVKKVTAVTATVPENKPKLPSTLDALQYLKTAKGKSDAEIFTVLDKALAECTKNDMVGMLEKVMLHIGDVSRLHNIFREVGIASDKGGAQERGIFRAIMRWWAAKLPVSFKENLPLFAEFTLYENLMYYQVTTDRLKGTVNKVEMLLPHQEAVWNYLAGQIRKGKDVNLIAKHLPKYETTKSRVAKKTAKALRGAISYEWTLPKGKAWVKINGETVDSKDGKVTLKTGDKITYPRAKQSATLTKQTTLNQWIEGFCKVMDWDTKSYKEFRKVQNTPEQIFSSRTVKNMPKSDFMALLDGLTAGQRFRVAKMVAYKDTTGNLQSKPKWGDLGAWYIEWEKSQEVVMTKMREAFAAGDVDAQKVLSKEVKVKATGKQTIDLLAELFKGNLNDMQINNTYQAMVEKMDLIANVFPIVDGSMSMQSKISGTSISYFDIVSAMCITFSTRNPEVSLRNTYGWFSNNFEICGNSNYKNTAPNPFVKNDAEFVKKVPMTQVLSETKTFTENLSAFKAANPRKVENTNMFASVEYFVKLVQNGTFNVEGLPQALLFLTDGENNTGKSPREAIKLANSIGWSPLIIYWGIQEIPYGLKNEKIDNCLWVSGFSEGTLSQILRGIKNGAIDPEAELWSIYTDKRYSLIGNN